jgi:hypothetical protein
MVNKDRMDMQSLQEKFLNNSTYDSLCSNIHFFVLIWNFPDMLYDLCRPKFLMVLLANVFVSQEMFDSCCFSSGWKWWLGCLGYLVVRWSEILSIQLMNDEKDVFQTLMGKTCFKCCVRWQRPLSTWTSQGQNGHKMFSKDSSGTDKWKTNWLDHMLVFVLFGGKDLCNQIVARFQRRRTVWV